jgi:hypothetical protein
MTAFHDYSHSKNFFHQHSTTRLYLLEKSAAVWNQKLYIYIAGRKIFFYFYVINKLFFTLLHDTEHNHSGTLDVK